MHKALLVGFKFTLAGKQKQGEKRTEGRKEDLLLVVSQKEKSIPEVFSSMKPKHFCYRT